MRKQKYQPEKTEARKVVQKAIAKGELDLPDNCLCFMCGKGRWDTPEIHMVYHHVDYTKPLEVFPLCLSCHRRWHLAMGDYPGMIRYFHQAGNLLDD